MNLQKDGITADVDKAMRYRKGSHVSSFSDEIKSLVVNLGTHSGEVSSQLEKLVWALRPIIPIFTVFQVFMVKIKKPQKTGGLQKLQAKNAQYFAVHFYL